MTSGSSDVTYQWHLSNLPRKLAQNR